MSVTGILHTILGRSNVRVNPEHCFDKALGDLYVARGARNYLARAIAPAVRTVSNTSAGRLANLTKENIIMTVERLRTRIPVLNYYHDQKKTRNVAGIYHLTTGRVELVA
jgi:carbonic anhydrase